MQKTVYSLLAACALALASPALAQDAAPAAATPKKDTTPHRIGLIDMAEVFQGYKKFEVLRQGLQTDIDASDAQLKGMIERMQKLNQEAMDQKFTPGSPQFEAAEKVLLQEKSNFEAVRTANQRKLARKESEMFKVIYADTTSAVAQYADYAKYTIVMRFDRKDIDENTAPQEAVQRMNKQIVFFRSQEDITDVVLNHLNKQYARNAPADTEKQAIRPVSGTKKQ